MWRVRLQYISHQTEQHSYLDGIRMALEGGCRWVQLRMKGVPYPDEDSMEIAFEAKRLCREHDAVFIIDDDVALVKQIHADGVHLGKNDMPISEARSILGQDFIIGGTANTFADVKALHKAGADYIGCGPFRFTTTKRGLSPVLGLEGYRSIVEQMKAEGINLPIVAIGGITEQDVPDIMQTGVSGIAVSGAVLNADNPIEAMRRIGRFWE